jgi:Undecaprenyl-phosphate glucose phosphotransferase
MRDTALQTKFIDSEVVQRLIKGLDGLMLAAIAAVLTLHHAKNFDASVPARAGFFALNLALLCLYVQRGFGLYETTSLSRGIRAMTSAFVTTALIGLGFYAASSYLGLTLATPWVISWFLCVAGYFGLSRSATQVWAAPITKQGRFRQRIAIVGGGKAAEDAIRSLENSSDLNIEIVGLFDDRYDSRSPESVRKHKKIGKITDLTDYARGARVDLIVVAIPMSAEQRLLQILKRLWELPVDIRISGQAAALKLSPHVYTYLGDLPLLAVFDRPLSGWSQFLKDCMDRVIALLAIIIFAPVMLAVACAVRYESKGPVIFKQKRFGFNNELIEVFKFRSMFADKTDASAAKLVTKDDPRVTRVGRFIRKTSLDELPQLFNVVTGQLSLVGPRPHATQAKAAGALYDQVVDGYFARHKVKPGITGWAQINGWRGETNTHEKLEQRVKHDLEYIDRWSLAFDFYILAKTPFALLKNENAY